MACFDLLAFCVRVQDSPTVFGSIQQALLIPFCYRRKYGNNDTGICAVDKRVTEVMIPTGEPLPLRHSEQWWEMIVIRRLKWEVTICGRWFHQWTERGT